MKRLGVGSGQPLRCQYVDAKRQEKRFLLFSIRQWPATQGRLTRTPQRNRLPQIGLRLLLFTVAVGDPGGDLVAGPERHLGWRIDGINLPAHLPQRLSVEQPEVAIDRFDRPCDWRQRLGPAIRAGEQVALIRPLAGRRQATAQRNNVGRGVALGRRAALKAPDAAAIIR